MRALPPAMVRAMGASSQLQILLGLVAPPSCGVCGSPAPQDAFLCGRCQERLAEGRPLALSVPEIDRAWAARHYTGTARELIAALKFRSLLPAARAAAGLIASEAPPDLIAGTLVPAPPDPLRLARRGFDPAGEIASELARLTGLGLSECLRRRHGPRQVGRGRRQRLASAPRVRVAGAAPAEAVIVDDVATTGATLSACAAALRREGCRPIAAVVLAAAPPDRNRA